MKAHLFCIDCLTNLHVGSGESNYNIIDNEVERDPVLKNVPVIHASGVKGALRAHCKEDFQANPEKLPLDWGTIHGANHHALMPHGLHLNCWKTHKHKYA